MAATTKSKKITTPRTKSAYADENFFHQLRAGGEKGWNDLYIDPKDAATNEDRFYLKYYGAAIACIELVDKDTEKQTKITVFGSEDKTPIPSNQPINPDDWKNLFDGVIVAIQNLYQA